MMSFGSLGLHVIKFPSGRVGYVGTIPAALGDEVPASTAAVMGGRAFKNAAGEIVEIKFPSFETDDAARRHAAARGYPVRT
jgi:hypothetical protein